MTFTKVTVVTVETVDGESKEVLSPAWINEANVDYIADADTRCIVVFNSGRTLTVDESGDSFAGTNPPKKTAGS